MYVSEATTTLSVDPHAPTKVGAWPQDPYEAMFYVHSPLALQKVLAKDDRRKLSFIKDIIPAFFKATAARVSDALYPKVEEVNFLAPLEDMLEED